MPSLFLPPISCLQYLGIRPFLQCIAFTECIYLRNPAKKIIKKIDLMNKFCSCQQAGSLQFTIWLPIHQALIKTCMNLLTSNNYQMFTHCKYQISLIKRDLLSLYICVQQINIFWCPCKNACFTTMKLQKATFFFFAYECTANVIRKSGPKDCVVIIFLARAHFLKKFEFDSGCGPSIFSLSLLFRPNKVN